MADNPTRDNIPPVTPPVTVPPRKPPSAVEIMRHEIAAGRAEQLPELVQMDSRIKRCVDAIGTEAFKKIISSSSTYEASQVSACNPTAPHANKVDTDRGTRGGH